MDVKARPFGTFLLKELIKWDAFLENPLWAVGSALEGILAGLLETAAAIHTSGSH